MNDEKVKNMIIANKYEKDYWDGARSSGYGGYVYDGRYESIASLLVEKYKINSTSRILDFGCGKGFLLYEINKISQCETVGVDISKYAISNSKEEIKSSLICADENYLNKFQENEFDLVISTMTLHNLSIGNLEKTIQRIESIGKQSILTVESYRNEQELFNLQCWALTCKSFLSHDDWEYLLDKNSFTGDVELMYFE